LNLLLIILRIKSLINILINSPKLIKILIYSKNIDIFMLSIKKELTLDNSEMDL